MRAVQVMAPGRAEFVETPKPVLKPGHALIRTRRLSLCGSDIFMLHYAPPEMYPFPPGTSGHEMVGVVESVDAPGSGIEPGMMVLSLVMGNAAMAEYYLAPIEHVIPLPNNKPIEELLQAQQLGTILYAAKHLPGPVIGKNVAVIGQGSVGLWWVWMLRRMGARRVMLPKRYGATHTINNREVDPQEAIRSITGGELADVVIEAAGEVETINLAYTLVRQHGDLVYFGIPHAMEMTFNFGEFFRKFPRVKAISGAMSDPGQGVTHQALEYIATGEIDVSPILTHTFSFDQVMDAYEVAYTRDEGSVKVVIEMPE
jgi:L-iditol 2-dehydrogenase